MYGQEKNRQTISDTWFNTSLPNHHTTMFIETKYPDWHTRRTLFFWVWTYARITVVVSTLSYTFYYFIFVSSILSSFLDKRQLIMPSMKFCVYSARSRYHRRPSGIPTVSSAGKYTINATTNMIMIPSVPYLYRYLHTFHHTLAQASLYFCILPPICSHQNTRVSSTAAPYVLLSGTPAAIIP